MKYSAVATYIHTGKDSLELTADDFDDRIINLKFIRKSNRTFIIRSDYEAVCYSDNTVGFMKCTQKPSILLKYSPLPGGTSTRVVVDIKNLMVSRESIGSRMDAFDEDPIMWMVVQIGYRKQFPDWTDSTRKENINQFYDLNNNSITTDAEVMRGRQIIVQMLDNYLVNGPPSSTWRFEGVVGTLDTGLRWNHTEESINDSYTYGVADFPSKKSQMEAVLYQWITRRFIRPSVQHRAITDGERTDIWIYGYKDYTKETQATNAAVEDAPDDSYTKLTLANDNLMTVEDANLFGVRCACSKVLCEKAIESLYTFSVSDGQVTSFKTPSALYADPQDKIGSQFVSLQKHYPFIRWYILSNGDFFLYHVNESESDLFNDPEVKEKQKNSLMTLPAVYSISMGGLRTITAPFISFVDPLMTVRFNSRYTLSDMTGYFYRPDRGNDYYVVILASIVFSTDGKGEGANCMTLQCTDLPNDQIPTVDETTGLVTVPSYTDKQNDFTSYIESKRERNAKWWLEVSYTVGDAPYDNAQLGWIDLARHFLLSKTVIASWQGVEPDLTQALTDLKEWNTTLWNNNLTNAAGDSLDNKAFDAGFKIPWLYKGDKITYRTPYRNVYEDAFKEE